jgi:hypothetical protein
VGAADEAEPEATTAGAGVAVAIAGGSGRFCGGPLALVEQPLAESNAIVNSAELRGIVDIS